MDFYENFVGKVSYNPVWPESKEQVSNSYNKLLTTPLLNVILEGKQNYFFSFFLSKKMVFLYYFFIRY